MLKTLAMKITEETYPIAVATLPGGFVLIRKKLVIGNYLVLNDLQFPNWSDDGSVAEEDECDQPERYVVRTRYDRRLPRSSMRENLTLANFWTPKKLFKKDFKVVGEKPENTPFFEVTRR